MITRQYTIWCDDKRACVGEHLQVDTNTILNARKMARGEGWRTGTGLDDKCPACVRAAFYGGRARRG